MRQYVNRNNNLQYWCEQNNRLDLLDEWHKDKNAPLTPSDISFGTTRKMWWACHKGHEWEASVSNRSRLNRGCPICAKESQTSFAEQAIFYYCSSFTTAINRHKVGNMVEVDVYLPEIQIAIEYDGSYYHKSKKKQFLDREKENFLVKEDIVLIRIKEVESNEEIIESDRTIFCRRTSSQLYLNEIIRQVWS